MGRIAHVQVWDYVDKLRSSTSRVGAQVTVLLLFICQSMDSKAILTCDYLSASLSSHLHAVNPSSAHSLTLLHLSCHFFSSHPLVFPLPHSLHPPTHFTLSLPHSLTHFILPLTHFTLLLPHSLHLPTHFTLSLPHSLHPPTPSPPTHMYSPYACSLSHYHPLTLLSPSHSSSLLPHSLSFIPHPSSLFSLPSSLSPHPSSLLPPSSLLLSHPSSLIPHPLSLIPYPSPLPLSLPPLPPPFSLLPYSSF